MPQNIQEIVILSDCSKEYKVGFELYKAYTKDNDFESPRDVHPTFTKKIGDKEYKIHFFAIQDSYWPAISNICKFCNGAIFAIDMENYTEEGGVEFIKEWLVNLDDLDKDDMKKVIVGISQTNAPKENNGKEEILELSKEKSIEDVLFFKITETDKINEAFQIMFKLVDGYKNDESNKDDDEMEEYLDKYKNF